MAPDALIAHHMNVTSGGRQPRMHNTVWGPDNAPQRMVLEDGQPKGLKVVLEERGICTAGMGKQAVIDCLAA